MVIIMNINLFKFFFTITLFSFYFENLITAEDKLKILLSSTFLVIFLQDFQLFLQKQEIKTILKF
jgi:hypothetical protein